MFIGFALLYLKNTAVPMSSEASNCQLAITVETTITGCPPYRPGRALVSASGQFLEKCQDLLRRPKCRPRLPAVLANIRWYRSSGNYAEDSGALADVEIDIDPDRLACGEDAQVC